MQLSALALLSEIFIRKSIVFFQTCLPEAARAIIRYLEFCFFIEQLCLPAFTICLFVVHGRKKRWLWGWSFNLFGNLNRLNGDTGNINFHCRSINFFLALKIQTI